MSRALLKRKHKVLKSIWRWNTLSKITITIINHVPLFTMFTTPRKLQLTRIIEHSKVNNKIGKTHRLIRASYTGPSALRFNLESMMHLGETFTFYHHHPLGPARVVSRGFITEPPEVHRLSTSRVSIAETPP